MRTKHKILLLAIALGLLWWLIDAIIDCIFFYPRSFWDVLLFEVPAHDVYTRLTFVVCFIIFGVILSRIVTSLERNQKTLMESRDYLEKIIESSLDTIVVVDKGGCITRVNNAFSQLTGFSKEEVIGKHMSAFAPPSEGTYESTTGELIPITREYYNSIMSSMLLFIEKGAMSNSISFLLRKDNKIVPVEDNMVYVLDNEGRRIAAVAITRDITERRKAEQNIIHYQGRLKELAAELIMTEEKDRRRFAQYLHDEIGQYLFASQVQLKFLRDSMSSSEDAKALDRVLHNIRHMIDTSRSLTYELSPPILYELGLEKALEWLVEQINRHYQIKVTVEYDKQERSLDDDMKSFFYHAVRELLTNVTKHAQAQCARISLERDNASMRISVKDDGIGFDPSVQFSGYKAHTYGLFSIRERLDQLGGHLEIISQPHCGTCVTLFVPVNKSP